MPKKVFAYSGLALLILVLLALIAIPWLLDLSKYKAIISQKASEAIGRQVDIVGDISLSILPMPHLSVSDIRVANIPGGSEKYFARLGQASAWVELWPLLDRKVNIRSVTLEDLDVQLEKNNWDFKIKNSNEPSQFDIKLSKISLKDSKITYLAAGKKTRVNDINLEVNLDTLQGPYNITGDLNAVGEPLAVELHIKRPTSHSVSLTSSSLELRKAKINLNLQADWQNNTKTSGNITLPGSSKLSFNAAQNPSGWAGNLLVNSGKPAALAEWASGKKSDSKYLTHPLSLKTNFAYADILNLQNLLITLGSLKAQGNLTIRPDSAANIVILQPLTVSGLDIQNPLIAGPINLSGTIRNAGKKTQFEPLKITFASGLNIAGKLGADLSGTKPRINANLSTSAITLPTSPNTESKERWSKEPMDLSALEQYEGQFDVAIPRLTRSTLTLENVRVHALLQNNALSISPLTAGIYGGDLDARTSISSKGAITLKTTLNNAQLNSIAPSESKLKVVAGVLNASTDLKTTGLSVYDLVSHLDGPVSIRTRNGRISGFDLDALIDRLSNLNGPEAFLNLFNTYMAKGSTAFNTYNGDVVFTQGVGKIQNMTLATNRAQGSATGSINLPAYTMDINAKLQITNPAGLPSFGAHLYGPIDEPKRDFDTNELKTYVLKNLTKGIIQNITKGQVPDLFNRLLGH